MSEFIPVTCLEETKCLIKVSPRPSITFGDFRATSVELYVVGLNLAPNLARERINSFSVWGLGPPTPTTPPVPLGGCLVERERP